MLKMVIGALGVALLAIFAFIGLIGSEKDAGQLANIAEPSEATTQPEPPAPEATTQAAPVEYIDQTEVVDGWEDIPVGTPDHTPEPFDPTPEPIKPFAADPVFDPSPSEPTDGGWGEAQR